MAPTIRDVAKLSGVSISTVSRVMNTPEIVSEKKRKKVQQAIEELGYRPNSLAQGLIFKKTHTVGVLIPDISNNYASELVKGLEDAGHELGVNLILCNTNRDRKRMIHYLDVLRQKQVDGIVFTSEVYSEEYANTVRQMKIPIVLVSTKSLEEDVPTVKINDRQAGFDAVKYLVGKGHQNIGMISGPKDDIIAGLPRYEGFKNAHKDLLNIANVEEKVEIGDFRYDGGYEAMKRLYEKQSSITAVFCASDEMALGAISYLYEQGINVPNDISILGFDNTKIAKISIPKLTTVAQPMQKLGKVAMDKLSYIQEGQKLSEPVTYLKHYIVERETVRNIKR